MPDDFMPGGFEVRQLLSQAGPHGNLAGNLMKFLVILALATGLADAADPFYAGIWKIASATVAPWQAGPPYADDTAEMKTLVGKTVAIQRAAIVGPGILGCKGPRYRVKDYPADMLFQGQFGEMHRRDATADPAKIAAGLGFKGSAWKTLETGCANELDFHFLDPVTASFGLNNYIYILKKQ
jgi:hypothetical protein